MATGLDTRSEYVTQEQEQLHSKNPEANLESPIGLGFRVPLIVASPWTKGDWVSSEVCDLTSCLQFLEHFLEKKTGKSLRETNLSPWRRLVCGDLTSVFREVLEQESPKLPALKREEEVRRIHTARNKPLPGNFISWTPAQLEDIRAGQLDAKALLPQQEPGVKPACPLPYDLSAHAFQNADHQLIIRFEVHRRLHNDKILGAPFYVYSRLPFGSDEEPGRTWNFPVREGEALEYAWPLTAFENGQYHLEVHGPNGFYRDFRGSAKQNIPFIQVVAASGPEADQALILYMGTDGYYLDCWVKDLRAVKHRQEGQLNLNEPLAMNFSASGGWYDFEIRSKRDPDFYQRYAGHIECGKASISAPFMGGLKDL